MGGVLEQVDYGGRCPLGGHGRGGVQDNRGGGERMGGGAERIEEVQKRGGQRGGRQEYRERVVDDANVAQDAAATRGRQRVFLLPAHPARCSCGDCKRNAVVLLG